MHMSSVLHMINNYKCLFTHTLPLPHWELLKARIFFTHFECPEAPSTLPRAVAQWRIVDLLWLENCSSFPHVYYAAAAAAKSLQSRPTLCDPRDSSPPGSPVPGILQARTLEWVAISFSNAWKWKVKVKSLSCVRLLATPWTAACEGPPPIMLKHLASVYTGWKSYQMENWI